MKVLPRCIVMRHNLPHLFLRRWSMEGQLSAEDNRMLMLTTSTFVGILGVTSTTSALGSNILQGTPEPVPLETTVQMFRRQ